MADDIDRANDRAQADLDGAIAAARGDIPKGVPGVCAHCEEWFVRLVGNACVPCREKFHLD